MFTFRRTLLREMAGSQALRALVVAIPAAALFMWLPSFSLAAGSGPRIVYFSERAPAGLWVMNGDGSSPQPFIAGAAGADYSLDGTKLVYQVGGGVACNVNFGFGQIVVADADGSHPVTIGGGGCDARISPDGTRVAYIPPFDVSGGTRVMVARVDDPTHPRQILPFPGCDAWADKNYGPPPGGFNPRYPNFDSVCGQNGSLEWVNDSTIVVGGYKNGLWEIRASGGFPHPILSGMTDEQSDWAGDGISVSPDGRTIVGVPFVQNGCPQACVFTVLATVPANGGSLHVLITEGQLISLDWPEWSPDGKTLVLRHLTCPTPSTCHARVAVMPAGGGTAKDLNLSDDTAGYPTFAPPAGKHNLKGLVTGSSGEPSPGVVLDIKGPMTTTATTGTDGRFSVDLPEGTYTVTPQAPDKVFPVPSPDCTIQGDGCRVDLSADRLIEFAGCVVPNPDGSPLPPRTPDPIPGAIKTQNLEAVGCWKPQADGNTFISTGPVRLDGLDLRPSSKDTKFVLDKSAATVHVEGPAIVQIKGWPLWPGIGGATLSFHGSDVAATDLGLGEAYGGFAGPRVAGVPLALGTGGPFGSLLPPWVSTPGQTQMTLNPVVPVRANASKWDWKKGEFKAGDFKVPNFGPQFTITTTNRRGLTLPQVCLTLGDQRLTPWDEQLPEGSRTVINGINGCYDFEKNETNLSGILELPHEPGFPDRFSASITFKGFQLQKISAQLDGFNKPLNPYVYFQRAGLEASWDVTKPTPVPRTIGLNGGLSFGPKLTKAGVFGAIVKKYPLLEDAELASLDFSGEVALTDPTEITLKGNILLFRRTVLQTTIAGGFVNYWTTGKFDWGGDLKLELPVIHAGLNANVSGFLDSNFQKGSFQLEGTGELTGLWGSPVMGRVLVNDNVVAVCPFSGGGYAYHWNGTTDAFPAGVCNIGNYVLPEPWPTPSTPPRHRESAGAKGAAASPGAGPYRFRIPAGLTSTTLSIHGTAAPAVTLTGPHGEQITTPKSGALHNNLAFLIQDDAAHTTYVTLAHPAAGAWTLRTLAGSAPMASVLEANPPLPPAIAASTALAGCSQQLTYTYHPAGGDNVALYVQNGSQRTFFGSARAGRHTVRFVPALSGGGQIIAFDTHNGLPRSERTILTFDPRNYRAAATPHGIRVRRAVLTWTPACGARSYHVVITRGRTTIDKITRANRLKLPKLHGTISVAISAIDSNGIPVTTARARLHA